MSVTLDMMEYASDALAQASYVSSDDISIPTQAYTSDANTKLLLHLDNNVTDSGSLGLTITNTDVTFSDTVYKFGYSGVFNGSSAYLSVPDNAAWDFGTEDFTIDFWVRFDVLDAIQFLFCSSEVMSTSWIRAHYSSTANNSFDLYVMGVYYGFAWYPSIDTWYHIAVVRAGSSLKIYVDGIAKQTVEDSTNITNGAYAIWIGQQYVPGNRLNGYIDEFRISNIARWTTNFDTGNLCCFSESAVKTQGSYSLKGVAKITDSLNDTLIRTVSPTIDLSGLDTIKFDIRASRTGSNIKIGIHDSGGTTTEKTHNISSANEFETDTWDISAIADANKNAIDQIKFTILNADAANTFYLDNMYAEGAIGTAFTYSWGTIII
jgi:hypothetical protein